MGRVVMLMPIAAAYAARCGYEAGSRGRTGILLAAALGTYLPSAAVLPANLPNIVLAAGAEQLHGIRVNYADYLLLLFPVLGAAKAALVAGLDRVALPRARKNCCARSACGPMDPEGNRGRIGARDFISCFGSPISCTAFHQDGSRLPARSSASCRAPACCTAQAFNRDMSFSAIFHAAGIIGLGAVVASSGMGETLGQGFAQVLPFTPGAGFTNFWLLGLLSTATCLRHHHDRRARSAHAARSRARRRQRLAARSGAAVASVGVLRPCCFPTRARRWCSRFTMPASRRAPRSACS